MKTKKKLIIASVAVILGAGLLATGGYFVAKNIKKPEQGQEQPAPDTPINPGDETPLTCEVKLVVNGEETTQTVATGGLVVLPEEEPTKEGYTFLGYAKEGTEEIVDFTTYTITENTTFIAVFEKNTYEVKIIVDGVESIQNVKYQEYLQLEGTPTKEGHTFLGYALEGTTDLIDFANYPIAQNVTFVAVFEESEVVTSASTFSIANGKIVKYLGTDTNVVVPRTYSTKEESLVLEFASYDELVAYYQNHDGTFSYFHLKDSDSIDKEITKIQNITQEYDDLVFPATATLTKTTAIEGNDYSITEIGDKAFYSNKTITEVTVLDNITSVGESAFGLCSNMQKVILPDTVGSIGDYAFSGCSLLQEVILPTGLTEMPSYVFKNCVSLSSITIPETVTSIGDNAFSGCSKLTTISFSNNLTTIGSSAFSGCTALDCTVYIHENVTSIGGNAFKNCTGLTINFSGEPTGVTTSAISTVKAIYVHNPYYDELIAGDWSAFADIVHNADESGVW